MLDAAAALFQSSGYSATSTQQIAAEAGVTHGAMHHHFATKKLLGLAVIRERVAAAVRETWIAPLARASTTKAAVAAILGEICAGLDARGAVQGCPLNNLALELSYVDADFREELRQVFDEWRQALADRLRAEAGVRRARGSDPEALAMFVVAAYSGAMAMAMADQTRPAPRCASPPTAPRPSCLSADFQRSCERAVGASSRTSAGFAARSKTRFDIARCHSAEVASAAAWRS